METHIPHVVPAPQKKDVMRKTIIQNTKTVGDPSMPQINESADIDIGPYESWRISIETPGRIAAYRIQCADELGGLCHYMTAPSTYYLANSTAQKRVIKIIYLTMN